MKSFKMYFKHTFLLLSGLFLFVLSSQAQSSAELKKQRERIDIEIAELQKVIRRTVEAKLLSQREVNALSRQINLREQKISTINSELAIINRQIKENNDAVQQLEAELEKLKREYEKMVLFAFRNKNSYNKLMFIFASKDFNQAFKRVKYLQQFTDARKIKVEEMEAAQNEIKLKIAQLEKDKATQNKLLAEQQKEREVIRQDRSKHATELSKITRSEQAYKGQLSQKQQEKRRLDAAIQAAIRREIEEERRRAENARRLMLEEKARQTGKTVEEVEKETPRQSDSEILRATPEAAKLSANFKSNQGRLPWPVAQGNVVRPFGRSVTGRNVQLFNPDIGIRTSKNAPVKVIFDGEVAQAFPGIVVVRHGEYFTSYSNLASQNVRKGQKVSRGDVIGTADEDSETGYFLVNFGVYQGQQPVNPMSWIAK